MSKNAKTNKNGRGPGRPSYVIKWPTGKFTFQDLEILNGVNPETGKGENCTKLTLRKGMAKDLALKGKSFIVKTDETRKPDSESGLGRKSFVFVRRSKLVAAKAAKKAAKTTVLAPVVTITSTPAPAPTPAPVAEPATTEAAPAVAETAPVAEPVAS